MGDPFEILASHLNHQMLAGAVKQKEVQEACLLTSDPCTFSHGKSTFDRYSSSVFSNAISFQMFFLLLYL